MSAFKQATKPQLSWLVSNRAGSQPLIELFEKALEDTKNGLMTATDTVTLHRMQGRSQTLKEFLELLRDAAGIVAKMEK